MPRASSLMRHRVVLQTRTQVQNEYNELVDTWQDGPTLSASFEPLRGGEYWKGQNMPQTSAQVEARVRIRWRKGLSPSENRLRYGGISYDIKSVIQVQDKRETHLMVTAMAVHQEDGSKVNV